MPSPSRSSASVSSSCRRYERYVYAQPQKKRCCLPASWPRWSMLSGVHIRQWPRYPCAPTHHVEEPSTPLPHRHEPLHNVQSAPSPHRIRWANDNGSSNSPARSLYGTTPDDWPRVHRNSRFQRQSSIAYAVAWNPMCAYCADGRPT